MSAIATFQFENQELRFVGTAAIPEWVGLDAVNILYAQSDKRNRVNYLRKVPDEWKGHKKIQTLGGEQEVVTVFEPGLYHLIARSNSPLAIPFQRRVFEEILPSIRKTGTYSTQPPTSQPQDPFADPEVQEFLETLMKTDLTRAEMRVLCQIRRAEANGTIDELGMPEIAARLGVARSTVFRAIAVLQDEGLVQVQRRRAFRINPFGMLAVVGMSQIEGEQL